MNKNRSAFLTGLGGTLAAAGTASAATFTPGFARPQKLIRLRPELNTPSAIIIGMRKVGLSRIDDPHTKTTYLANGTILPYTRGLIRGDSSRISPNCSNPQVVKHVGPLDAICPGGGSDLYSYDQYAVSSYTGGTFEYEYFVSNSKPPVMINNSIDYQINAPIYDLPPIPASVAYWNATQLAECVAALGSIASQARSIATYIDQNLSAFPARVGIAAQAALSAWGPAGAGVAAAAEFIIAVAASLTAGEWLTILGGLALGSATVYLAIHCAAKGL